MGPLESAANEPIEMRPIGIVRSGVTEQRDTDWGDVRSSIEVSPEFAPGLRGLEEFSHAVIATYLHQAAFDPARHLQRRPRGLAHMPLAGIFAQRAKDRPNPLGITAVRILAVSSSSLEVQGLDAIDGTPVLDIKPYVPDFDAWHDATVPAWMSELMQGYFG
jgi:tRNA-Thr(GGU) m(6)t(6)A37 methyltransferase TsaA